VLIPTLFSLFMDIIGVGRAVTHPAPAAAISDQERR
jgi:hypothetical protein